MKLSYVVATPDVRGTDATAYVGPLEPFFAHLQRLGYDGVELMIRDPDEIDVPALRKLAAPVPSGGSPWSTPDAFSSMTVCT